MVNILLNGCCGKMGSAVSVLSKSYTSIKVAAGIDKFGKTSEYPVYENIFDCLEKIDVILDFSRPNSLDNLLNYSKQKGIPIVLCTTGYTAEQIAKIEEYSTVVPLCKYVSRRKYSK